MVDLGWTTFSRLLNKYGDRYPLLYVKDILVWATIKRSLFLLGIPMKIKQVNARECLHEAQAHSSKGRTVEITVIGNKGEDASVRLLDSALTEADEFDVIVAKPLSLSRLL